MKYLIKQAVIIPVLYFIPVLIAGFIVDNYDLIKQHASEVTISNFYYAKLIINIGFILTGFSIILFAFGIIKNLRKFYISSILLIIFGLSMFSNGLYPMENNMHGIYGIGLSQMLLPFVVCYELKNENVEKLFFNISLITGFVIFIYFWSMIVGFDPSNYKGLTQRLASAFIFGWLAYFAFVAKKL